MRVSHIMIDYIPWLGHASFRIEALGFARIYIDSWKLGENPHVSKKERLKLWTSIQVSTTPIGGKAG